MGKYRNWDLLGSLDQHSTAHQNSHDVMTNLIYGCCVTTAGPETPGHDPPKLPGPARKAALVLPINLEITSDPEPWNQRYTGPSSGLLCTVTVGMFDGLVMRRSLVLEKALTFLGEVPHPSERY
jgi:hypothetical protein